jgi:hypothetical protein
MYANAEKGVSGCLVLMQPSESQAAIGALQQGLMLHTVDDTRHGYQFGEQFDAREPECLDRVVEVVA